MYEGGPMYPQPDRFWDMIDRHKVTVFYTAPTAIRAFMRLGESWPAKHSLKSLRLLGSVGEPINPEAWMWYREHDRARPMPHRRYMVADRNGRDHDQPAAGRDADEARFLHAAAARH